MNEKLLHVQVAEALGCRLAWHGFGGESIMGDWACVCASGEHGEEAIPSYVLRYDLEWSAAGPLIEEYGITICKNGERLWSAQIPYVLPEHGSGTQPLIAVCHLFLALRATGKLEQLRAAAEAR